MFYNTRQLSFEELGRFLKNHKDDNKEMFKHEKVVVFDPDNERSEQVFTENVILRQGK